MDRIHFAFYVAPGRWQDRLIRWATDDRESHVELITDRDVRAENWTISASKRDGAEVREKLIKWKEGHWEFVSVSVPDFDKAIDRAVEHIGAQYDTLGAIRTITPWPGSHPENWFCSELMAYVVGLPDPYEFTPGSFRRAVEDTNCKPVKEVAQ